MTNLDSIFKSRDITLPTKVCRVKTMVFPVVMYGCESCTVKKATHMDTLSLTKEARIYNGVKTISLTSGAGKTGQPLVKE